MIVGPTFLDVGAALGLACASSVVVIVLARIRRGRIEARSRALLGPYRNALLAMVSGEDEDLAAKALLSAVPARIWVRLRPSVVAFLPKVRGGPAVELGHLMRAHGEIERAARMLTSRSAVRRARAAYLIGLVRWSGSVLNDGLRLGDQSAAALVQHADV